MREIFDKALALLDEYSDEGNRLPEDETIDLQTKAIVFADMAQKELYALARIEKTFNFSNSKVPNLLGDNQFNQVDFIGEDQVYPIDGVKGAKSYYFEAFGQGTCIIEEYDGSNWSTLTSVNIPVGTAYMPYMGTITVSNPNYPVRLRFTGTTFYRHVNRCLYSYPFTLAQIPPYREWVNVKLPDDFMDINQLITESIDGYAVDTPYKWEYPSQLYVRYDFVANYRMIYKPIPVTIADINSILECNAIIGQAIVYYVAAKLAPFEIKELVNFFEGKYNELKADASKPRPVGWEKITSNYGGWSYGSVFSR